MGAARRLGAVAAVGVAVAAARRRRGEAPSPPELTEEDRATVEVWVDEELQRLRAMPYAELLLHEGQRFHCERLTPSGAYVQRETTVHWDGATGGPLRVFVDAWSVHVRTRRLPMIAQGDFIRAPDGSFIGE